MRRVRVVRAVSEIGLSVQVFGRHAGWERVWLLPP
jgi:hypothetical protein